MLNEYFKRRLLTTAAENHKIITELIILACSDSRIEKQIDQAILALQKSNSLITKLAKARK
jgi:hypothetical protein